MILPKAQARSLIFCLALYLLLSSQSWGTTAMEKQEIYFAGGCFWGVQEYFSRIPGVLAAISGYAQSDVPNPTYEQVCSGATGAAETVAVVYNPARISLDTLVDQYFKIIDPFQVNRQGNDIGPQYRTGIYFASPEQKAVIEAALAREQAKYDRPIAVKVEPVRNFYPAETWHQDYLKKNPGGYCHIDFSSLKDIPGYYDNRELKKRLDPAAYHVTRENGTEPPFSGKYWDNHRQGAYVDVVSGEPLFLSTKKFDSGSGWPSFTSPVDAKALEERLDTSHGMKRVEVRSASSDSHLGHVFDDGPNGLPRYCINSAALRFIPLEDLEKEGYGYLRQYFK